MIKLNCEKVIINCRRCGKEVLPIKETNKELCSMRILLETANSSGIINHYTFALCDDCAAKVKEIIDSGAVNKVLGFKE